MASNRNSNGTFKRGTHWRQPRPHWDRYWLLQKYEDEGLSASEIGALVGCKENNIYFWLAKHGIKKRSVAEARSLKKWGAYGSANGMYGKCGEANPNWKGGITPERAAAYAQAMWKAIKKAVFNRDRYKCRKCGADLSNAGPKERHTHHLRPWAKAPALRFDIDNIICICRKCHETVHSRRNAARELLE